MHNALGFCYFSMEKVDIAIEEYRRAVELQQGYVTAWNNLGDAYERSKEWRCVRIPHDRQLCTSLGAPVLGCRPKTGCTALHSTSVRRVAHCRLIVPLITCRSALEAYQEALAYAPNNKIAMQRADYCRTRVQRLNL